MIIYKDVITKLKAAGYATSKIREEKLLPESTLTKLRHNKPVNMATLDKICELTGLQPADLIEYVAEGKPTHNSRKGG